MKFLKFNFKSLAFLGMMAMALSITFSSCGDDEVEGCTDPAADNYNPEATVSSGDCTYSGCTDPDAENYNAQATNDDGTCVYARDKFVGEYTGVFECGGILSLISDDMISFTIEPGLDPALKNQVIVTIKNVSGFDIPLTATAMGSELSDIDAELLGIPVSGITSDVRGTGTATIDQSETTLTASIELMVTNALLDVTETCTLVGTKQ